MASFNHTRKRYDVFISFRGTDTRDNFTSHLHSAFDRKTIRAYLDEESLQQGDEISLALMKAIQESNICVVILSENYANSSWCLEELAHIMQCMELDDLIVVPVFYRVAQSDVREQQGSFGAAFDGLRERRKKRTKKVEESDVKQEQRWSFGAAFDGLKHRLMTWTKKVEQSDMEEQRESCGVELDALDEQFEHWRKALRAVADIWGWDTARIRPDSKLIEEIVNDIWKRLYAMASSDHILQGLVGVDKRCEKLESLLHLDTSHDVRVVGIVGMGGLGKTTLAHVAYNRFSSVFEGSCFLENVKQKSRDMGNTELQKHLFSQLLNDNCFNEVNQFVIKRLRCVKVLIVLDDVDEVEQLEQLLGDLSWFCGGSRIMITTRDMQILNNIGCHDVYEVESLDWEESLELFSSKAFHAKSPPPNFIELSQRVISYAIGNPLALTVLGRHLYSKSVTIWESELKKLERIPNKKIHDVLKISYDGLDPNEKAIFLDIAHFFKGISKSLVEAILDGGGHFVATGIQGLVDKSLLTIKYDNFLIHDLLREMGLQIVRQESEEPGKRSRLCLTEEILSVLKYNKGTGVVRGMFLQTVEPGDPIQVNPLVFKNMYNLRYLKFHDYGKICSFSRGIHFIPETISYLDWKGYPLKALPLEFKPNHLVELQMRESKLERLWSGTPQLGRLKILDLELCENLIEVPDLSQAINLEILNLNRCESIFDLPHYISELKSMKEIHLSYTNIERVPPWINSLPLLEILTLMGCGRLRILPINIRKLKNLRYLFVGFCLELESIPEIQEKTDKLSIAIHQTGITKLPKSIENLIALRVFHLNDCTKLTCLPAEIYTMKLTSLNLSGCSKLTSLPPFTGGFETLEDLNLSKTSILQVPEWVFSLPSLDQLDLNETDIARIPDSVKSSCLTGLYLVKCKFLQCLPELPPSLVVLNASGCESMETVSLSSKGHGNMSVDEETLLFWDSFNLDCKSIQQEFLNRSFRSKELGAGGCVAMCYPGDQIPEWCLDHNEGYSINFSGLNFMELVFCVAIEKITYDDQHYTSVGCRISIQICDGLELVTDNFIVCPHSNLIHLGHVIMLYYGFSDQHYSSALNVSFKSYIVSIFHQSINCKIKWCGYGLTPSSLCFEKNK